MGHHPGIVKGMIIPGVVLIFPNSITRGYFRGRGGREGGEDGGVVGGAAGGLPPPVCLG
jgi:hypothetical protein